MSQGNVSSILSQNYSKPQEKSMNFEESLGNRVSESIKEKDIEQKEKNWEAQDSLLIQTKEKNSHLMKKLIEANEEIEVLIKLMSILFFL